MIIDWSDAFFLFCHKLVINFNCNYVDGDYVVKFLGLKVGDKLLNIKRLSTPPARLLIHLIYKFMDLILDRSFENINRTDKLSES